MAGDLTTSLLRNGLYELDFLDIGISLHLIDTPFSVCVSQ